MAKAKRSGKDRGPMLVREGNVVVRIYTQDRTKQGKGMAYHVADNSTGRRRLRTFADLGEATREAQRLARLLATGQVHAATFSSSDAASYGQALALLAPTGASLETACALFAEGVGIVGNPALVVEACRAYKLTHAGITAKPVGEAVAEYIALKTAQGASPRYIRDLRYRLGRFADAFLMDLDGIPSGALQQWLDAQRLAPQGVRNFKTVLGGLLSFGMSRGWCAANPAEGITVARVRSSEEPEIFTASEFTRLLTAAAPDFVPVLVLCGLAGIRTAEAERVRWEDVNFETGELVIGAAVAKTRSRRVIPLCDSARQWLAPYRGKTGKVWAMTGHGLTKRQIATAAATEVRDASGKVVAPAVIWKANGLRHGFGSHRLALTGDAVRVSAEMGNSPSVVHRHYKALVSESDGRAWFSITPTKPANIATMPRLAVEGGKERVA